jgi:LPXTG-motif cell wall-anchored protein
MKKLKHNFKKGMAFVLSLAMVAGLVPAMSGGANTVQAATGSGTEPSVTAYATKDQLMTAFNPDSNGDATTIGKLVFGKNSSSVAQEWYILGRDTGVSGDNTIIFAASPIARKQAFEDDDSNKKTFASSFGVYETNPSDVYQNHYGASDLRVALKNMATNTSYFTTAEQGLMNPTTVTTNDILNSTIYTTTDKLYALTADGAGFPYTTIKVGSDNNTVLAESSYWRSGELFWLRSPSDLDSSDNIAWVAYPGKYVYGSIVSTKFAVQPASNLNLSSAATAASSDKAEARTIADGTAMTLRLDGTGKDIGTATYNTTTGDIKAVKGATSQTVALVVQGNDGTNNWYYSKKITGTDVVNVSDIVAESNTPASIDLSACKIWLEATDSTENLTYAVNATETTIKIIHSVAITDIETPVSNTALDTEASCATTGVSSTTPQITWTSSDTTAGYNTSYTASITLTATTGYEFIDSTTATVSGNNATSITKNTDGTLTVTYDFPATAKDRLISITTPQAITVANGTAYSDMNLPEQVNIVTEGNTVSSASVTWNTTTPAGGSYEPSELTEQTVILTGTVTCPDSIDDNGIPLTTTITITISAAGIVGAPTVNLAAGTYTENQSVTLTSSTEGATIYYTTDGSEPTITGGVPAGTTAQYTAPIAVTGTEGQSITTTIKAIAVKDRMQNSSVETFTYTIQIPVPKYEVTVTNGSGSGNYAQGSTVTITANTAPNGQRFKEWTIESGNITLASSTSDTTTFVMPAGAVSVKANYEAIPTPVSYKILDGANSDWKQNTEETITIRGNGDFSKFVGVKIDGNTIDAKNYTAKEGSTIITLTTDYLKTLSIGTHTFEIVWTDGSASTNFTVSKNDSGSETPKDDDKNKNDDSGSQTGDNHHITAPQTGDNSHLTLWISLLGASLIGLLATLYMRKKKDNE